MMASTVETPMMNNEEKPIAAELAGTNTPAQARQRVPLKKRVSRRKETSKHRLLHQGSSSLEPKHPAYKKYGHIKRVNFAIFLKIFMHHLLTEDKELHAQAQEVSI